MTAITPTNAPMVHTSETTDGQTVTLEIARSPIKARFGVGGESDFLALTCQVIGAAGERWPGLMLLDAAKCTVEVSWNDTNGKNRATLVEPDDL